ncbi:AMP-dependent synthetase/ligase [Spongisporangium articulatum]|uniref:AMP-dependent synthetase/ligase n=1 Tax=Spongisporangium articulatum TaxID=3362603 RepID=A0ABW8AMC1_9ACTN
MDGNTLTRQESTARPDEVATYQRLLAAAPASLGAMFVDRVRSTPDLQSYLRRTDSGEWLPETWNQTGVLVTELAAGLLGLGLRPEDRVAVAAATRVEWIHADLAILCAGGATTTVYPTSSAEDVEHVVSDSGSRFAIVENDLQLAKLVDLPLEYIVLIDGEPPAGAGDRVLSWAQLRERGRAHLDSDPQAVVRATEAVRGDQLATLIYTSGTTGRPKGVRLSHSSWVYEAVAQQSVGLVEQSDLGYLWLPMAHSFGKTLLAAQIASGHAAAVDGDVTHIVTNLPVLRPTTMAAAPRVYEKVHAGVYAAVRAEGGAKQRIFEWAVRVGLKASALRQEGRPVTGLLAAQFALADRLVFSTVRERLGGRIRFMISGSAPLSRDIAEWFDAVGLRVLEGYGLTETSAGTFVNRLGHNEFGTVGLPMPGTSVRIAEDGEVLIAGPGVMQGYHHLEEATAEVLHDGWFHTGDIGEITERGSLRITDRKKDLIKTSGGKYVAPQQLETQFKVLCPLAAQIVVHGDGRNFITALIALDPDALRAWATARGQGDASFADLARSPQVRAVVQAAVDALNDRLGRWETIKKFEILDRDLTVEAGDLTPSLKLKRRHVERQYADVLDGFYR